MALRADRYEAITDITYFMNSEAERGGFACLYTAGSGSAMDQSEAEVRYINAPSSYVPWGLLLQDVVDINLTRQEMNLHKDEVQKGGKVCLLHRGWAVTDMVRPGITPLLGDPIFVYYSGLLTNAIVYSVTPPYPVGRFGSTKDAEGFCKVYVDCPPLSPIT